MLDAKEILKNVTPKDVIEIMQENGSSLYKTGVDGKTQQNILWFRTICHGGDSHKLCYFTESKDFFCYTNCGRMTFYDFIKRIRDVKDADFYKVVKYVAQKIGYYSRDDDDRNGIQLVSVEDKRAIRNDIIEMDKALEEKSRVYKREPIVFKNYNEEVLDYFEKKYYTGWIDDGISIKSMEKFKIRWYERKKHIIIPHYDINGRLIGIRRRTLNVEEIEEGGKYKPEYLEGQTFEHSTSMNLYGLFENQEAIKSQKRAIIVEGEKSVLLSDTFFGNKSVAVATCSFNISTGQIDQLLSLGVKEVTVAFDKDFDVTKERIYSKDELLFKKYKRYREKIESICVKLSAYFNVYLILDRENILKEKDSPFDRGKNNFEILFKSRIFY